MSVPSKPSSQRPDRQRVVVISGGTDGMVRMLARERVARGDRVVVLGSNADKGKRLLADAAAAGAGDRLEFLPVDLSSVSATRAVIDQITERHPTVDALSLFANRQAPKRVVTEEGLERTFALYYLSRYLLGHGLAASLRRSDTPVIINVAGTGATAGQIHWDDLQLERRYSTIMAQLQAGRANDLLGVSHAAQAENPVRYVLYHPGFTRSGDLSPLPPPVRVLLRVAARLAARPVTSAVEPIHDFIDDPPGAALSAIDRGTLLPLSLKTLDPTAATRLAEATEALLRRTPQA